MLSKIVCIALVGLFVQVLATPELCPDPSTATKQVYKEEIHADAPLFGRVSKEVSISTNGKIPTCLLVTGLLSSESQGLVAISAIGLSKDGDVTVQLVSSIDKGIDVLLEVYTE